jgi:hypothetical protein
MKTKDTLPSGWFTPNNIQEYRKLVEQIPHDGKLAELGVWQGRSLCSISDILKRKNIKITAIDTFKGVKNCHYYTEAQEKNIRTIFENNCKKYGLTVEIFEGTTDEASIKFKDRNFDLIFIDADHSYEAVKKDILNWQNKTKILAGHDYNYKIGVRKAVDELLPKAKILGTIWCR